MVTQRGGEARRDRAATEARILRAVGRVLSRRGFHDLTVNGLAREARVDKVLIYRYFGGLPELLAAFARQAEFWPAAEELLPAAPEGTRTSAADRAVAALKALLRGLLRRPLTQEVLRWELAGANELTEKLAAVREEQGLELLARVAPGDDRQGADLAAVAAVLTAGITYLVLRSRTAPAWLGVSLRGEEGWRRIEGAVAMIARAVLRGAP
jgi:AcrR family transcriptional regulator